MDQAETLRGLMRERTLDAAALSISPQRQATPKLAHALAISSGKGGVGKSTVAVNLAIMLSRMGRRVALLDADMGTANADVLCNVMPVHTLAHVVTGRREIEDIAIQAPGGFSLIPGASGLAQMAALRSADRQRLLEQFSRLEQAYDVLLIDTGAGIGPGVLGFLAAADRALFVTTPDPTAITDVYAVIKTARRQHARLDATLLVNQASDPDEASQVYTRVANVCQKFLGLDLPYAGCLLSDTLVRESIRKRRPFALDDRHSQAYVSLSALAHRLDKYAAEPEPSRAGLLRRMTRLVGG